MRPSLDLLKSFVIFARSKNIVEAAKAIGITQPALTAQLKRLEDQLPLPPFTTEGKKKILNAYGQQLLSSIGPHLEEVPQRVKEVSQMFLEEKLASIRVAGRREMVTRYLRDVKFKGSIEAIFLGGAPALKLLEQRKVDLVITQRLETSASLLRKKCYEEPYALVVSKKLLRGPYDLESFPYYSLPAISYNEHKPLISQFFSRLGRSPKEVRLSRLCEDWTVVLNLVRAGLGWSIVPASIIEDNEGLRIFEIPDKYMPRTSIYFFYSRDFSQYPWFKQITAKHFRKK